MKDQPDICFWWYYDDQTITASVAKTAGDTKVRQIIIVVQNVAEGKYI